MSHAQAQKISCMYKQLEPYDKKPLLFVKRYSHKAKCRFARSRKIIKDANIDYMKSYRMNNLLLICLHFLDACRCFLFSVC